MAVCLIPLSHHLPVFHYRPSYMQTTKSKLSHDRSAFTNRLSGDHQLQHPKLVDKHDIHVHNSLSQMQPLTCMESSRRVLSIGNDFCVDAYLQLQWITCCTGLATLDCFVKQESDCIQLSLQHKIEVQQSLNQQYMQLQ